MTSRRIAEELRKKPYLIGKELTYARFIPSFPDEHTFCVFCWARISLWQEDLQEGFCEPDSGDWICEICEEQFEKPFEWIVVRLGRASLFEKFRAKNGIDIPLV